MAILEGSGLETELAPMIAEALLAQGRDEEAAARLDGLDDAGRGIPWQVRARTARARLHARNARWESAVTEAQEAVVRAALLDDVNLSGDAYAALAEVLSAAGEADAARDALGEAAARYELKGNVVGAQAVLALRRA